jgi:tetratricopeptide (TPR) repeat protein
VRSAEALARSYAGDTEGALLAIEEAERLYETTGDRATAATGKITRGQIVADKGDLARAEQLFGEALATMRAVGKRNGMADARGNLIVVNKRLERYPAAVALSEESANDLRQSPRGRATDLYNIGNVHAALGDLAKARRSHEEALAIRRTIAEKQRTASSLAGMAEVALLQGDADEAARLLAEADALEVRNPNTRATIAWQAARVAIARGEVGEAVTAKHAAACDALRAAKVLNDEAYCRAVQARALFVAKRPAESLAVLDEAAGVADAGGDKRVARLFAIEDAYVRGMVGPGPLRARAMERLDAVIEQARAVSTLTDELDARLARTLVEQAAGRTPRESLAALEREATARGQGEIAALARARRR